MNKLEVDVNANAKKFLPNPPPTELAEDLECVCRSDPVSPLSQNVEHAKMER